MVVELRWLVNDNIYIYIYNAATSALLNEAKGSMCAQIINVLHIEISYSLWLLCYHDNQDGWWPVLCICGVNENISKTKGHIFH